MGVQLTGSLDVLGSVNTLGTSISSLGSREITGSLSMTGSMEIAYLSSSITSSPGSWSTCPNMNRPRYGFAGFGIANALVQFGGQTGTAFTTADAYDGTSWSTAGNVINQWLNSGAGSANAGLSFGGNGNGFCCTEAWDGSSWSAKSPSTQKRSNAGATGTQADAIVIAGNAQSIIVAVTEEYNYAGDSWTTVNPVPAAGYDNRAAGTTNAALSFGGITSGAKTCTTQEYDGTSWSTGGALATARETLAGAGTPQMML